MRRSRSVARLPDTSDLSVPNYLSLAALHLENRVFKLSDVNCKLLVCQSDTIVIGGKKPACTPS